MTKAYNKILHSDSFFGLVILIILLPVVALSVSQGLLLLVTLGCLGLAFVFASLRYPLCILLVYVAFIPIEEILLIDAVGTLSRLAGIAFAAVYLFNRRLNIDFSALSLPGWLWLGWACLSALWSINIEEDGFKQLFQLLFMTLLIADYLSRHPKHLNFILGAFTVSASVVAALGVRNFFSGLDVSGVSRASALEGQSVAHFAFYLLPALLFLLYQALNNNNSFAQRVLAALPIPLLVTAILISGTRSAWLAAIVSLFIIFLPRLKFKQVAMFVGLALLSVLLVTRVPVVANLVTTRVSLAQESGGSGRTDIWKVGGDIFFDHPVIGVGFGNFKTAYDYESFLSTPFNVSFGGGFEANRAAHNIYLEIAAELGVVGLMLWFVWMGRLLKTPTGGTRWVVVIGILAAMLMGGIFTPVLNRKYFWLAIGLAEGVRRLKNKKIQDEERLNASLEKGSRPLS